ncbi:MAG: VIT family protein [Rikenellaceae bacterium]|nr:VIT family protein [Rikenellaceae bacterium]
MPHTEHHYTNRTNWLRAAVLGANDGILSTTSIVIGVAAANSDRNAVVLAALAGLVAGACSMAAGEYVSVSSQTDVETADLAREKDEIDRHYDEELEELARIYESRGLDKALAMQVATELMNHNALEAHARDELGINNMTKPHPLQAALASAASFISGGLLPFLVAVFAPLAHIVWWEYVSATIFLAVSGAVAAKMGGSHIGKSILRICFWGTIAMASTALIGHIFGTTLA